MADYRKQHNHNGDSNSSNSSDIETGRLSTRSATDISNTVGEKRDTATTAATQKSAAPSPFVQHDDPDVIIPFHIARPLVYSAQLLLANAIVAAYYGIYGLFAVLLFVYLTSIWHWSAPRFSALARRVDYVAVLTAIVYGSVYVVVVLDRPDLMLMWFVGLTVIAVIFVCNETSYYMQVMKSPSGASYGTASAGAAGTAGAAAGSGEGSSDSSSSSSGALDGPLGGESASTFATPFLHPKDKDQNGSGRTGSASSAAKESTTLSCCPCSQQCSISFTATQPHTAEREWVYKRTTAVHLLCIHVLANALACVLIVTAARGER